MTRRTKLMMSIAYLTMALALSGCMEKDRPSEYGTGDLPQSFHKTPSPAQTVAPSPPPAKKDLEISSPTAPPDASPSAHDAKKQENGKGKSEKASNEKETPSKPSYDITEPYDASKPKLMGFTLHDPATAVVQRFGNPQDTFKMDDPESPIKVYDYPGFSIGFDNRNEIVFIEVSSSDMNPGLNGFRLGMATSAAVDALGKPDSKTDYVLSYKSGGVVLKMDVDPAVKKVISIKLFAAEE